MSRAIEWFARNSVAANLLMGMLVLGGLTTLPAITMKTFPDLEVALIRVVVEYRGAAPEETEEGLCIRVEEEIDGVEGIDRINSVASEGICTVTVELLSSADEDQAQTEIKNRVDAIDTFPEDAERPIVSHVTIRRPVIDLALSGDIGERALKVLGQRLRDELAELPEITQVELLAVRPYEISIEVSEETLRRHGLSFDRVVAAVRRSSLDLPGGSVKTEGGEILFRTKGQAYVGKDFERIVVLTRADGTRLSLGQIADVVDGFEDTDQSSRFGGEPAAIIRVFRVGNQDTTEIGNVVKAWAVGADARLPEGVSLTLWQDSTRILVSRLDTLLRNGRSGFILVLLVLALFLKPRLALWTTLGVPISFLGALWVFPSAGLSIDAISLFAFILVLGILVDDAVVVAENVHTHEQRGTPPLVAAIRGTQEVAVPVIFGVLTTVAAFAPALFVPGPMGQIFGIMSTVVIVCLLFSLVESQLVLPAHLGHRRVGRQKEREPGALAARWDRFQQIFSTGLERFATGRYRATVGRAIEWRYLTVSCALALLLITVGTIASGRIGFSFFPPIESDYISAVLTMPQGTPVETTAAALRHIERSAEQLRAELDPLYAPAGRSVITHVMASLGSQPSRAQQGPQNAGAVSAGGSHLGEVTLELIAPEERDIGSRQVAERWRELTGSIPDATELVFPSDLFSAGDAINFQLQGPAVHDLRAAADRLKAKLAEYPGVVDIGDSFRAGKQEVKLAIHPTAEPLGLTLQDLARQVRQAFYGEEAQRVQRGRDDVRVMVRYPADERRSLADLENMRIRTADGAEVPFRAVADAELGRGFASIRRSDRRRVVNVTADIDRGVTTANEVIASISASALPEILADYQGISYSLQGEQREQQRAMAGLARGYLVAIFVIYALLAVPLRSYLQPLLIMGVIPFGVIGSIAGHLLLGFDLAFMSVIGIIAMSGVVVNSSLLLMNFVNQHRAEGASLADAVTRAGVARFRPIVLTATTTFVGLTPLMLEQSMQAQFLIPMAISLAFGVAFATGITLLVVPAGYLILDDGTQGMRRWLGSGDEPGEPPVEQEPSQKLALVGERR